MDPKKNNTDPYTFPHEKEHLALRVRPTANAWWKDPFKVYLLLEAFDNHYAPIDEACYVAGITRKQYKYFAQEHPVIYERRREAKFAKRKRDIIQKQKELGEKLLSGRAHAQARYLRFTEPVTYDLRYRSDYARLRRITGLPADDPLPINESGQLWTMANEVEKTRIMLDHPSDPKHYAVCPTCEHLFHSTPVEQLI